MKYINYIVAGVLIIVIAVCIGVSVHRNHEIKNTVSATKTTCYAWNTPAGDKATMTITQTGTNVTGIFNYNPAEKDSETGSFSGTISDATTSQSQVIESTWNVSGEGMTANQQLRILIDGAVAKPGFGEMKDAGNNSYIYANPDAISYSLALDQTDCTSQTNNPVSAKRPPLPAGTSVITQTSLTAHPWTWTKTISAGSVAVTPNKSKAFVLKFTPDGKVTSTTDCNSLGGNYQLASDGILKITNMISTLMYCQNSQESVYTTALGTTASGVINAQGNLVLTLSDGGSMIFTK